MGQKRLRLVSFLTIAPLSEGLDETTLPLAGIPLKTGAEFPPLSTNAGVPPK